MDFIIPARRYSDPVPVSIPHLIDVERTALSYAYFDKPYEVRVFKNMAGVNGIISGWDDVTRNHDAERFGRLNAAMKSLERFGLVESYYDHRPTAERTVKTDEEGLKHVVASGWRYRITDTGKRILKMHNPRRYFCCEGATLLNCVCLESTFCAEHGGGCHGTHD